MATPFEEEELYEDKYARSDPYAKVGSYSVYNNPSFQNQLDVARQKEILSTPYSKKSKKPGKTFSLEQFDAKKDAEDRLVALLEQSGTGNNPGLAYRYAIDAVISEAYDLPFDQVVRNHKAYVRAFAGKDVEDKSFLGAIWDAVKSDATSYKIAGKQLLFDFSSDETRKARLLGEIEDLEKELVVLGDYKKRSWGARLAINTAPMAAQLAVQVGAALLTGGASGLASGVSELLSGSVAASTALRSIGSHVVQGALGATAASSASKMAAFFVDTAVREYGSMSRNLYKIVDENGNRMSDGTRIITALTYGIAASAIEYATFEPAFDPIIKGFASPGSKILERSFLSGIQNKAVKWTTERLVSAASEALEEFLQAGLQSVASDIAKNYTQEKGIANIGGKAASDAIYDALYEGVTAFKDAFMPSLLLSVGGDIVSAPFRYAFGGQGSSGKDSLYGQLLATAEQRQREQGDYFSQEQKEAAKNARASKDEVFKRDAADLRKDAARRQHVDPSDSSVTIIDIDDIIFKDGKPYKNWGVKKGEDGKQTPQLLEPIDVEKTKDGYFIGINKEENDKLKWLYDHGATGFAVRIAGALPYTSAETMQTVVEDAGGTINGKTIYFENQEQYDDFLGENAGDIKVDQDNNTVTILDENGKERTYNVSVAQGVNTETAQAQVSDNGTEAANPSDINGANTEALAEESQASDVTEEIAEPAQSEAVSIETAPISMRDFMSEIRSAGGRVVSDEIIFNNTEDADRFLNAASKSVQRNADGTITANIDGEETTIRVSTNGKTSTEEAETQAIDNEVDRIANEIDQEYVTLETATFEMESDSDLNEEAESAEDVSESAAEDTEAAADDKKLEELSAEAEKAAEEEIRKAENSAIIKAEGENADESKATVREGLPDGRGDRVGSDTRREVSSGEGYNGAGDAQGISERIRVSEGKNGGSDLQHNRAVLLESALKQENPNAEYVPIPQVENTAENINTFISSIEGARQTQKFGLYVDNHTAEEYAEMKLFLSEDKSTGFAIKPDGDIVAVFSDKTIANHPMSVYSILAQAIENGGTKLDCYGEKLLNFYMQMGFVPVGKVAYNEEYEGPEWTAKKDVLGSPDVYALYYGDSGIDETLSKLPKRLKTVTKESAKKTAKNLPLFEDAKDAEGNTSYGYDLMMTARDKAIENKEAVKYVIKNKKMTVTDYAGVMRLAEESQDDFRATINKFASVVGTDAVLFRPKLKDQPRMDDKARDDYGGNYGKILDVNGATLLFDTYEEAGAAFDKLNAQFGAGENKIIIRGKNFDDSKNTGYMDYKVNIVMPNGFVGEAILMDKAMHYVKEKWLGHAVYNPIRKMDVFSDRYDESPSELYDIYGKEATELLHKLYEDLLAFSRSLYADRYRIYNLSKLSTGQPQMNSGSLAMYSTILDDAAQLSQTPWRLRKSRSLGDNALSKRLPSESTSTTRTNPGPSWSGISNMSRNPSDAASNLKTLESFLGDIGKYLNGSIQPEEANVNVSKEAQEVTTPTPEDSMREAQDKLLEEKKKNPEIDADILVKAPGDATLGETSARPPLKSKEIIRKSALSVFKDDAIDTVVGLLEDYENGKLTYDRLIELLSSKSLQKGDGGDELVKEVFGKKAKLGLPPDAKKQLVDPIYEYLCTATKMYDPLKDGEPLSEEEKKEAKQLAREIAEKIYENNTPTRTAIKFAKDVGVVDASGDANVVSRLGRELFIEPKTARDISYCLVYEYSGVLEPKAFLRMLRDTVEDAIKRDAIYKLYGNNEILKKSEAVRIRVSANEIGTAERGEAVKKITGGKITEKDLERGSLKSFLNAFELHSEIRKSATGVFATSTTPRTWRQATNEEITRRERFLNSLEHSIAGFDSESSSIGIGFDLYEPEFYSNKELFLSGELLDTVLWQVADKDYQLNPKAFSAAVRPEAQKILTAGIVREGVVYTAEHDAKKYAERKLAVDIVSKALEDAGMTEICNDPKYKISTIYYIATGTRFPSAVEFADDVLYDYRSSDDFYLPMIKEAVYASIGLSTATSEPEAERRVQWFFDSIKDIRSSATAVAIRNAVNIDGNDITKVGDYLAREICSVGSSHITKSQAQTLGEFYATFLTAYNYPYMAFLRNLDKEDYATSLYALGKLAFDGKDAELYLGYQSTPVTGIHEGVHFITWADGLTRESYISVMKDIFADKKRWSGLMALIDNNEHLLENFEKDRNSLKIALIELIRWSDPDTFGIARGSSYLRPLSDYSDSAATNDNVIDAMYEALVAFNMIFLVSEQQGAFSSYLSPRMARIMNNLQFAARKELGDLKEGMALDPELANVFRDMYKRLDQNYLANVPADALLDASSTPVREDESVKLGEVTYTPKAPQKFSSTQTSTPAVAFSLFSTADQSANSTKRTMNSFANEEIDMFIQSDIYVPLRFLTEKYTEEAQKEIAMREMMKVAVTPAVKKLISECKTLETFLNKARELYGNSWNDTVQTMLEKAYAYAKTPTPAEMQKSFIKEYNSLEKLLSLKRTLGNQRIYFKDSEGNLHSRKYAPEKSAVYKELKKLNSNSSDEDVKAVLESIKNNPAEWIKQVLREEANYEKLTEDDYGTERYYKALAEVAYLSLGEEDFEFVKSLRAANGDEDVELAKETEETLSFSGAVASGEYARAVKAEKAYKDMQDKMLENFNNEYKRLQDEKKAALKKLDDEYVKKYKELYSWYKSLTKKEKDRIRDSYETQIADIKKKYKEEKKRRKEVYEERLANTKEHYKRRIDKMRINYAVKEANRRITAQLKKYTNVNTVKYDAKLVDVAFYLKGLIGDKYDRSGYVMSESEIESEKTRTGNVYEEDGIVVIADPGEPPLTPPGEDATLSLGINEYDRSDVPEMLAKYFRLSFTSKELADKTKSWNDLSLLTKSDILQAVGRARQEAAAKQAARTNMKRGRRALPAFNAVNQLTGASAVVDEDWLKSMAEKTGVEYVGPDNPFDTSGKERKAFVDKMMRAWSAKSAFAVGDKKNSRLRAFGTSFAKISSVARQLDGGNEGVFFDMFVTRPQKALNEKAKHVQRRTNELKSMLENKLADDAQMSNKEKRAWLSAEYELKQAQERKGPARKYDGWELIGIYVYAKTGLGFNKLVSNDNGIDGNNIHISELAKIDPESTLAIINEHLRELELSSAALALLEGEEQWTKRPILRDTYDERYLRSLKAELEERIANGEGSSLPAFAKEIGDGMLALLKKETPRLEEAAYNEDNKPFHIIDNYMPFRKARGGVKDIELNAANRSSGRVFKGMLIDRKDVIYELDLKVFDNFLRTVDEQEEVINMEPIVGDLMWFMSERGGNLRNIVSDFAGPEYANYLMDHIAVLAGNRQATDNLSALSGWIISNVSVATLGFNPMSCVKQLFSIATSAGAGYVSVPEILAAMYEVTSSHTKEDWNTLYEMYGADIESSSASWAREYIKNSLMQKGLAGSDAEQAKTKVINASLFMLDSMDQFVKKAVWAAAYKKAIGEGMSEKDAGAKASTLVKETQSASSPDSLSPAQRDSNGFQRLVLAFTKDNFQVWNQLFFGVPQDYKNKRYGKMAAKIGGAIAVALLLALVKGGWVPDDDDDDQFDEDEFRADLAESLIENTIPIIGVYSDFTAGFRGSGYSNSLIAFPGEALNLSYRIMEGQSAEQILDQLVDVVWSAAALTGAPTTETKRAVTAVTNKDPGYLLSSAFGDWDFIDWLENF